MVLNSNIVAFLAQWCIMLWIFLLQIYLTDSFGRSTTILTGVLPVVVTVALVGWTTRLVVCEIRNQKIENTSTIADPGDTTPQQTDMVLQTPMCGDSHAMPIKEFESLYEPTHETPSDLGLARQGFQTFKPKISAWAHKLTADDISSHFPARRFISKDSALVVVHAGHFIVLSFPGVDTVSVLDEITFNTEYDARAELIFDGQAVPQITESHVVFQADVLRKWGILLQRENQVYFKTTKLHAKRATEDGAIKMIKDGVGHSRKKYNKGDYIVCGSRGQKYPMDAAQFSARYDTTRSRPASDRVLASAGFKLFSATGKVSSSFASSKQQKAVAGNLRCFLVRRTSASCVRLWI